MWSKICLCLFTPLPSVIMQLKCQFLYLSSIQICDRDFSMLPIGWIGQFSTIRSVGIYQVARLVFTCQNPFHHFLYIGCSPYVVWPRGGGYPVCYNIVHEQSKNYISRFCCINMAWRASFISRYMQKWLDAFIDLHGTLYHIQLGYHLDSHSSMKLCPKIYTWEFLCTHHK